MKTVAGQLELIQQLMELSVLDEADARFLLFGEHYVKVDILKDYFTLPPIDGIIPESPRLDCGTTEAVPNVIEKT